MQLLLELDREGDDILGCTTVLGDPLRYGRKILALLSEVILHGQVDEVDDRLGGDELDLFVDEGDLGWGPASVSDGLVFLEHLL